MDALHYQDRPVANREVHLRDHYHPLLLDPKYYNFEEIVAPTTRLRTTQDSTEVLSPKVEQGTADQLGPADTTTQEPTVAEPISNESPTPTPDSTQEPTYTINVNTTIDDPNPDNVIPVPIYNNPPSPGGSYYPPSASGSGSGGNGGDGSPAGGGGGAPKPKTKKIHWVIPTAAGVLLLIGFSKKAA